LSGSVQRPSTGMFELDEAGKIKVWHDYFNLATFTRDFLGLL
jgi:hypothetical protein